MSKIAYVPLQRAIAEIVETVTLIGFCHCVVDHHLRDHPYDPYFDEIFGPLNNENTLGQFLRALDHDVMEAWHYKRQDA